MRSLELEMNEKELGAQKPRGSAERMKSGGEQAEHSQGLSLLRSLCSGPTTEPSVCADLCAGGGPGEVGRAGLRLPPVSRNP